MKLESKRALANLSTLGLWCLGTGLLSTPAEKIHGAVLTVEMTILNIEKLCRSDLDSAEAGFHPQDPYR